jgi:glucosamine--fructose-6-phosphate aminotransferase (isomerizing)
MCGISGIVSSADVSDKLIESLRNLEYRGYDSCGIAVLNGAGATVRKNTGYVADVAEKEMFTSVKGRVGIAHTRWATHGKVTSGNAHPHLCCGGNIAVVHNGIITNYRKLKSGLVRKNHRFKSETDSEVVAHLVEENLKTGVSLETAFVQALRMLEGSFAVAMVSADEQEKILCGRNESPLILGLGEDENYIGSDFNAFVEYTRNAVVIEDGEYAVVSREGYEIKRIGDLAPIERGILRIEWDVETARKGGYPHYMLKEIHEQPSTIGQILEIPEEHIREMAEKMLSARNIFLMGVGTTYYSAMVGQYYFSSVAGMSAYALSSDEAPESTAIGRDDLVLAISQSGETYDTLRALKTAGKNGARTAAIVNVMGSSMARMVESVIMQGSGPEICVVSTKAATSQMVILMRLALEAGVLSGAIKPAKKKALAEKLSGLPAVISDFLNEHSGFARSLAQRHAGHDSWLYLGRGVYYPVALESALKVKEVAYQHAEGMPAGFLKHGTIALIDDKIRSMVFFPQQTEKDLYRMTVSAVEEIKARGGKVVAFHSSKLLANSGLLDDQLLLPKSHPFIAPVVSIVAAQLYAYFTATALGRNVDKPRALAKSVTVA